MLKERRQGHQSTPSFTGFILTAATQRKPLYVAKHASKPVKPSAGSHSRWQVATLHHLGDSSIQQKPILEAIAAISFGCNWEACESCSRSSSGSSTGGKSIRLNTLSKARRNPNMPRFSCKPPGRHAGFGSCGCDRATGASLMLLMAGGGTCVTRHPIELACARCPDDSSIQVFWQAVWTD